MKVFLRTISTGVILGLIALVIWAASLKIIPAVSKPASQPSISGAATADISPKKTLGQTQSYFGQEVQAYILPVSEANYLPIRNFNLPEPELTAKAAGIFDLKSEKLLYSKNISEKLPIASVTKLMTAVVIMENMSLTDVYTVAAEDMNADGGGADLNKNEVLRGADLLKVMLIESSNDAALVFASNASQKGISLVSKMNEKATALGMNDTKFSDPAGLSDGDSFSTVADLVRLIQYVDKYPVIWEILALPSADVSSIDGQHKHHLASTNRLLGDIPGIIGGKTGFTQAAMETMVLEVKIDEEGDRVAALVLGSSDRFSEIKTLINWAKTAYIWK